jgi:hypothetical protein
MKSLLRLIPLAVLALTAGCMRANTMTTVSEDGSWSRTVKFTIPKQDMMGKPGKFEDFLFLPSGAGWKTGQATDKENLVFTATRDAKLGDQILDDLRLKQKGKAVTTNTVTVRDLGNGRYEFVETIKFTGEMKPGMDQSREELFGILKESLEGVELTESQAKDISLGAMKDLWRIMFGPTRPLLPTLAMHPDLGERELRRQFGRTMDSQFEKVFGDKLTKEARLKAVRTLMTKLDAEKVMGPTRDTAQPGGGGEGGGDDNGLVSMTTTVKLPGRIVETNGEVDEVSGEVFWAFYSEATMLEPLVLRAVCEVKPAGR